MEAPPVVFGDPPDHSLAFHVTLFIAWHLVYFSLHCLFGSGECNFQESRIFLFVPYSCLLWKGPTYKIHFADSYWINEYWNNVNFMPLMSPDLTDAFALIFHLSPYNGSGQRWDKWLILLFVPLLSNWVKWFILDFSFKNIFSNRSSEGIIYVSWIATGCSFYIDC